LFRLFRDLRARQPDHLDSGWVVGHVSLMDKAAVEAAEKKAQDDDDDDDIDLGDGTGTSL
ncbi:MAG: hypothetical protein GX595_16405, partial [Lentisphaerae bacterium]|nr:hypothetical protein [Lentisphaerota bacterium]